MEKVTLIEKIPIIEPNENGIKYTKDLIEYLENKMQEISGIKLKSLEHKNIDYGKI